MSIERSVRDVRGQRLSLARIPRRIVSLVPSLTETVCALGRAERLVGVTRYCTDPPEAVKPLPKVGGTKNPDCQRIIALEPDIVLANAEENRREDVECLERAGLPVLVTFPKSVRDAAHLIAQLGRLLATQRQARLVSVRIERNQRRAAAAVRGTRWRVFCPIWRNPWMGFNRDTYAHDVLWQAGGANICADRADRYPSVDLAEIAAAEPEVILLPSEPYRFEEKHLASLRPLHESPAWRCGRVFFVDGQALSWYGPRTAPALPYFQELLGNIR